MKLLLLLEHIFFEDEESNCILSEGVITNDYLMRYLEVFDEVILCARAKSGELDEITRKKFNIIIDDPRVSIVKLPYAITSKEIILNFNKTKKVFKETLNHVDRVILRGPSLLSLMLYQYCVNKVFFAVEFVSGANQILDPKSFVRKGVNKLLDNQAKHMCLQANGVSYVTESILQQTYPSYSIKYGTTDKYFDSSYSSLDLYDDNFFDQNWQLSIKPKIYKIVHIGSMANNRKGQFQLLKAGKILMDKGYEFEMHFLGDGKLKESLIQYIKDNGMNARIKFYGNINDRSQVFEIIRNSHLFVLPSSMEGLPRSIIEAMANGLPCIASNVDGIPELVEKDYLIDCNDIKAIAEKIEYFMNHWDKMIEVSNRNYHFSKKFNYTELSKKRKEFYLNLKNIGEK